MEWEKADDIQKEVQRILAIINLPYIQLDRVFCYRTHGAKARAYARTWGFPKIFQQALGVGPAYVIEVIAKHFDPLDDEKKIKVLIHELLHIPKNFSGALVPHQTRYQHLGKTVDKLFKDYQKNRTSQK